MGIPARTYFCNNGHIVDSFGHHEYGDDMDYEWSPVCDLCGSTNIKCVTEWGDPDYYERHPVPIEAIGKQKYPCKCCNGDGVTEYNVYDVSQLFNTAWPIGE